MVVGSMEYDAKRYYGGGDSEEDEDELQLEEEEAMLYDAFVAAASSVASSDCESTPERPRRVRINLVQENEEVFEVSSEGGERRTTDESRHTNTRAKPIYKRLTEYLHRYHSARGGAP
jgi:hypothetical protein